MKDYRIIVTLKDNYTNEITENVMDRTEFSNFAMANMITDDYEIINQIRVELL